MSNHNHNHSKGRDDTKKFSPAYKSGNGNGGKQRKDYPRITHQEEYSAEVAPREIFGRDTKREERHENHEREGEITAMESSDISDSTMGSTVGYVGVGLGILSLFMWSIILGPIAAIMGFYAYSQGRKTSGAWSIGLGILATLSYFILIPMTR
ncbi:hypothetical protein J2T12_001846 [Paenibacillus anaericanus]|uniref:hypothetical protein n=1 Tax=Paenibacillus TaxID=44249 RepID=UPI001FEA2AD5|nr:hypothetical protein [Paenibacillus anaericanus]MDQ0088440.1 hypothetical protein [Paenibacillus anaericanus]